jgi:hypothetical protein
MHLRITGEFHPLICVNARFHLDSLEQTDDLQPTENIRDTMGRRVENIRASRQ